MWCEGYEANILTYQMVEYFSGKGRVSRVFRSYKKRVASYELKDSDGMDFLSCGGFSS